MNCEIDESTDICNLYNCVIDVKGQESVSTSPSDAWFLTFDNTFYNGEKIDKAFLKLFADVDTIKDKEILDSMSNYLTALNYEMKVYKDIINPLLNQQISPNFIRCLATQKGCTYGNLLKFLKGKVLYRGELLNDEQVENILNANIKCLLEFCDDRNSINSIAEPFNSIPPPDNNIKYNMILNKNINNRTTMKYDTWLSINRNTMPDKDLWETVFQIVAACYAMSLSKLVHNDLHLNNMFIEDLGEEISNVYVIDKKFYVLNSRWKILVYDFDRSYAVRFGDNPVLNKTCYKNGQCNTYIENKDIFKSLCYIINNIEGRSGTFKTDLLHCLTSNSESFKELDEKLFGVGRCNFKNVSDMNQLENYLHTFNSSEMIVRNIGQHLPAFTHTRFDDVYLCDRIFFNDNGEIDSELRSEIYEETINLFDNENDIITIISRQAEEFWKKEWPWETTIPRSSILIQSAISEPIVQKSVSSTSYPFIDSKHNLCEGVICEPDKICNPESGLCVLRRGRRGQKILKAIEEKGISSFVTTEDSSKLPCKRPCLPHEICNKPKRNCVLRTGRIGLKILKEENMISRGELPIKEKEIKEKKNIPCVPPCDSDKICNTEEGNCVKRTGRIGRKLTNVPSETFQDRLEKALEDDSIVKIKGNCNKPCPTTHICSPKSKRCIRVNGNAFLALEKEYDEIYGKGNYVFPLGTAAEISSSTDHETSSIFKVYKSLDNGNCFYSSVYRSLKHKGLLNKVFECIPSLKSTTENTFIKKFRTYVSNNITADLELFFDMLVSESEYEDVYKSLVKNIGDIKDVINEYYYEGFLVAENKDDFIRDIKSIINTDKKYVGEIEVSFIKEELEFCGIKVNIFNNKDTALEKTEEDSTRDLQYDNAIYLLNKKEVHWVYVAEKE
jgi:hypothetical protein